MDIKLDHIDIKLLEVLQKNARITNKALAKELNLSITPIFKRVKRLEKNGVIDKYVALLNGKKIDKKLIVFLSISIKNHTRLYLDKFAAKINSYPEALECYHVGGEYDFLLKVVVKDIEAYETFLLTKLSLNSDLAKVKSNFVLSTKKNTTAYDLK